MATEKPADSHATHCFTNRTTLQKPATLDSPLVSIQAVEPEDVPILVTDPRINDAPQLESTTEWYYLQAHLQNGSLTSSDDPQHTVFVCLFRQSADNELESTVEHNWGVIYATLDWQTQKYATYSRVPPSMPRYAAKSLEGNHSPLSEAIRTMINAGPKSGDIAQFIPDELFNSPVQICQSSNSKGPALHLEWDDGAYLIGESGSYRLKVPQIELDIQVHASRPIMLHGDNGETLNDQKACMFYYSWPRTEAAGEYKGEKVVGTAWVDHEYSLGANGVKRNPEALSYGWRWFSLLTSGAQSMEITITQVMNVDGIVEQYIVYHDQAGKRHKVNDFTLVPSRPWVSGHTFQKFDTCWRLTAPTFNIDVEIASVTQNQEFTTWLRMPSFYEGALRFSGIWDGDPIKGFGAMELVNETNMSKFMDQTLKNATLLVREEVEKWVPPSVRPNHFKHITGVLFDSNEEIVIQEKIVNAFYMLNNRGGKNWRPMLFGAAVGLVGGDANKWRSFLVIPELIHTASLIIDDIEDESEARRGGPCVHKMLGIPTSINAGCAIYFWGESIIRDNELLTDRNRREIYPMYFEMMRVGHAGQALDIAGMTMEKLPSIEEAEAMLARVVNLHRCKSGIPASFCGLGGAVVGGGTPEQIEAIGTYVQNLGIAFQMRDDVLDVLGKVQGKNAADDLYNHKITYPVAKLFTLDHPDREKWFGYWEAHDVGSLVDALMSSGTMSKCNNDIQHRACEGWDRVDSLTPNSHSKILFRMFANFLIEQHY